ncbi:MAG TPA: type II toxin-antitoxin system VapC family toxin [Ilumatobacter sp.]|nr:type II toxin-antitoxin system VapC family toxin [Ilumatobacter sp.]
MTLAYLDASAAMKLVVEEAESAALADGLASGRRLVASWLLHTELHCAAGRHPQTIDRDAVQSVLSTVDLVDITRGDLLAAGTHTPLRSNDAIHLAVALRLGVDEFVAYDTELTAAATAAGVVVFAPGVHT